MEFTELEKKEYELNNTYFENYWKHYLSLEKDFFNISNFITIAEDNMSTYSPELQKLIISLGVEIDATCQYYCKLLDKNFEGDKIKSYCKVIQKYDHEFNTYSYFVPELDQNIKPWDDWIIIKDEKGKDKCKEPFWWRNYQDIKHNRNEIGDDGRPNYKLGNLKTALYCLYALFHLESCCQGALYRKCKKIHEGHDGDCIWFEYRSKLEHLWPVAFYK